MLYRGNLPESKNLSCVKFSTDVQRPWIRFLETSENIHNLCRGKNRKMKETKKVRDQHINLMGADKIDG